MLVHMATQTRVAQAAQTRPTVISIPAAAQRLGVCRRTIDRYVERGLLVRHRDAVGYRAGVELAGVEAIEAAQIR